MTDGETAVQRTEALCIRCGNTVAVTLDNLQFHGDAVLWQYSVLCQMCRQNLYVPIARVEGTLALRTGTQPITLQFWVDTDRSVTAESLIRDAREFDLACRVTLQHKSILVRQWEVELEGPIANQAAMEYWLRKWKWVYLFDIQLVANEDSGRLGLTHRYQPEQAQRIRT